MDLASAARTINETGYAYISSWALLTACELKLFDRLPARAEELSDISPDADLVETWLHVLAGTGVVEQVDGVWQQPPAMGRLLTGDNSYAEYLGGQVLRQMAPRLTLGETDRNLLAEVLAEPGSRTGYEGWFADARQASAYQASQYAGSVGPSKAIATSIDDVDGRVLDLGGGWGAIARAVARHHETDVDVVDLPTVVAAAPPLEEPVTFIAGNALDPATWPTDTAGTEYDGAVLSYLFSSVPGRAHEEIVAALAARDVRWIAIHDFMVDGGAHAAAWALQHAVFVPGHRSYTPVQVRELLGDHGYEIALERPLVDEMTTLVIGRKP